MRCGDLVWLEFDFCPAENLNSAFRRSVDSSGDTAISNNYKQWVGFKWVVDQKNGLAALADSLFPINWESVDRSSYARAAPWLRLQRSKQLLCQA